MKFIAILLLAIASVTVASRLEAAQALEPRSCASHHCRSGFVCCLCDSDISQYGCKPRSGGSCVSCLVLAS